MYGNPGFRATLTSLALYAGFLPRHGVQTPLKFLGSAAGSSGRFLGFTIVCLYFSSQFNMVPTTSGFFEARLTYSQGSSSRLNKQGPASWVHWQGTLGGLPHVTTAFLRVWGRGAFCRSSTPGGAYQPLHPLPVVTRYHQRLDNDNDENNVTDSINDNDAKDNDNEKNDSQNDDDVMMMILMLTIIIKVMLTTMMLTMMIMMMKKTMIMTMIMIMTTMMSMA